jgi:ATP-dependent protease ClpP protease subunit
MPTWNEILSEVQEKSKSSGKSVIDDVRREYLKRLSEKTGRNVIAYYSGYLNNPGIMGTEINDLDKNGFMTVIHKLDKKKGLDLLLHTPGGDLAAAESLVDYIRSIFGNDVRAIIPQIAMSAGTMVACSCKSIVMGKQSNIGPIDPQLKGISASGVIEEFERAKEEVAKDPKSIPVWQVIIGKYYPTFVGECEKANEWSKLIVTNWHKTNMLKDESDRDSKVKKIVEKLSNHSVTKAHARHINIDDCEEMGLNIERMELDGDLQDAILSVHHSYMITFANTPAIKITENQNGVAMIINKGTPSSLPPQVLQQLHVQQPF